MSATALQRSGVSRRRSSRSSRLPPPVPAMGEGSVDELGNSDIREPIASSLDMDALRTEMESLAKMRRERGRGDGAHRHHRPAAAGKLVASSAGPRAAADTGGRPLQLPAAPTELSNSVVPSLPTAGSMTSPRSDWASGQALPNGDSMDISGSGGFPSDRQHLGRRQLVEWGDQLYREVGRFEQDKTSLEQTLVEYQTEIEQLRRRCIDLEHYAAGLAISPRDAVVATAENGELRKQLAAYAVEIDVLREERESGNHALREAQEAVEHLKLERDGLKRSLMELDQRTVEHSSRCEHLEGLLNSHKDHHNVTEGQLMRTKHQLDVAGASLSLAQDSYAATHRIQSQAERDVAEAEKRASEKEQKIQALIEVIQPLREHLSGMQDAFVKQTREFQGFIQQVRQKQQQAVKDVSAVSMNITAHWEDAQELPQLLETVSQAHENAEQCQSQQLKELQTAHQVVASQLTNTQEMHRRTAEDGAAAHNESRMMEHKEELRKANRKNRLVALFHANIAKQMIMVCIDGLSVMKVHNRTATDRRVKKEQRKVLIDQDSMRLKWVKAPFKFGKTESFVELDSILSLVFGCRSRAAYLFPDERPELCIGVLTVDRTYDFICQSQQEAEAMVLSISRLCARISGWSIPGSIHSRSRFLSVAGWTKVENACRKERKTLCAMLVHAITKAVSGQGSGASVAAGTSARVP